MKEIQAIRNLTAVLCDPVKRTSIRGSDEDNRLIDESLKDLSMLFVADIDLELCYRGMEFVYVTGSPGTKCRQSLIEEAVAAFQEDPENALTEEYFGYKNYSGFGDQRSDHEYGYGPRHGSIVFSVRRVQGFKCNPEDLDLNAVTYLLLAVADFGSFEEEYDRHQKRRVNLCDVLKRLASYKAEHLEMMLKLKKPEYSRVKEFTD